MASDAPPLQAMPKLSSTASPPYIHSQSRVTHLFSCLKYEYFVSLQPNFPKMSRSLFLHYSNVLYWLFLNTLYSDGALLVY